MIAHYPSQPWFVADFLRAISPYSSYLHRFYARNVSIGADADKHGADLRVMYTKYVSRWRWG